MPQITIHSFTANAIVESFEAITPNSNTSSSFFLGSGFLLPGRNSSYSFTSGSSLIAPIPNRSDTGVVVGDFSRGDASWGLLEHGNLTASEVPHGTAYLAINSENGSIEIQLNPETTKVGAFVTAAANTAIQLQIFDSNGTLLETASQPSVFASAWGTNFLGIGNSAGISKARWRGDFLALDQLMAEGGTVTALPSLSIVAPTPQVEGNAHSFTVNLSTSSDTPVTVNYSTTNGTAIAGTDYTSTSGTLTFAPGELSKTITVNVLSDANFEPDETFTVNLSNPIGASIATATATGTILNDDPAPQFPALTISNSSQIEGVAQSFTVNLSFPSSDLVAVSYATTNGTAIAGTDYTATSGTLTFSPGETSKAITVNVLGDRLFEPDETFTVTLSNPVGATIAAGTATGTIQNDDRNPNTDLNGDGKPDLLWRNSSTGENIFWLMNNTNLITWDYLPSAATGWAIRGAGDFNSDGNTDLVWRNSTTGENVVWYMNGTSYASFAFLPSATLDWQLADVADFNGDGKPDLLWRNSSTGENGFWLMNGISLTAWISIPAVADLNWQIAIVGDFNDDGHTDIVWRNYSTGQNFVWFMNGTSYNSLTALATVTDPNWRLEGSGDFDGDGKLDLVWRYYSTGENLIWYMNGTTIASLAYLPAVADLNWRSYT